MKTQMCLLMLIVNLMSIKMGMATSFSWRHPEGRVWFQKIVPSRYIQGTIHWLSNPQQYRALLYILSSTGWQRYSCEMKKIAECSAPVKEDGSWVFWLNGSSPLDATFAVLIVEPPVAEQAPSQVDTLYEIPHAARDIHANVQEGDAVLYSVMTKQTAADYLFYYYDPLIARLSEALQQTDKVDTASDDTVMVLIVNNVKQPGIYEVGRKFELHAVLEAAGGYRDHEEYPLPYAVEIYSHIWGTIEVEALVYQEPLKLPHEQPDIFLKDGDVIKVPKMLK